MIKNKNTQIVEQVVVEIYVAFPWLWDKYGEHGRIKTFEDNEYHFESLKLAYSVQDPQIFLKYVVWLEDVLTSRGVSTDIIIVNFEMIQKLLIGNFPEDQAEFYERCLNKAIETLSLS